MNSAPHLRLEDRPEFERVLDEALRGMARSENAARPQLTTAQLRALAIGDAATIAAGAANEYAEYVRVRERLRQPAPAAGGSDSGTNTPDGTASAGARGGPPSLADSINGNAGAGLFAVVSVLMPVLAGTAAVIFLLVGYALGVISPEPTLAEPMRNVGWVFAVVTVVFAVIGAISLLLTASRNAPTARRGTKTSHSGMADEVSVARAAWRHALTQRGIHPYLREAQLRYAEGEGAHQPPNPRTAADDAMRGPRLGYSGPDFSSPTTDGRGSADSEGHRFSSPKYTSPDPESRHRSSFSSPNFSSASTDTSDGESGGRRYSSPNYASPTTDGRGSADSDGHRFSSPNFSSPKAETPDEDEEGHRFSSPEFGSPDFDTPDAGRD